MNLTNNTSQKKKDLKISLEILEQYISLKKYNIKNFTGTLGNTPIRKFSIVIRGDDFIIGSDDGTGNIVDSGGYFDKKSRNIIDYEKGSYNFTLSDKYIFNRVEVTYTFLTFLYPGCNLSRSIVDEETIYNDMDRDSQLRRILNLIDFDYLSAIL